MKVDLNSLHEDMLSCCKSYRENPQRYSREYAKMVLDISWKYRDDEEDVHFERNLVSLDGALFLMTLPFEGFWRDIEARLDSGWVPDEVDIPLLRQTHPLFTDWKSDISWPVTFSLPDCEPVASVNSVLITMGPSDVHTRDGLVHITKKIYGFRPLLIPLTSQYELDWSFGRDNPSGSILEGGTFSVSGKTYGQDAPKTLNVTNLTPFSLGDTIPGMKPLKWLSWYGMLYATRNLCYISLKELYLRGLIFG